MPISVSPVRTVLGIEFLALTEVKARTGLPMSAIRRAVADGALPAKKIGGGWYVTPLWLDEWLTIPSSPGADLEGKDLPLFAGWRRMKARIHRESQKKSEATDD